MSKKLKKLVSIIAILTTTAILAACGNSGGGKSGGNSGTPVDESVKEFKIFAGINPLSPDNAQKPLIKQMNEALDVSITWECVSGDLLKERKNLMLATGDLPDAFMGAGLSDYELITGAKDGTFIKLEEYINAENTPNLMKVLEARPTTLAAVTLPDGSIYSMPRIGEMGFKNADGKEYQIGAIPQFTAINNDWLKKLNLTMPKTIDDFHDALTAFKTKDPNGNGKNDEIPLTFIFPEDKGNWCAGMTTFFAPFGFTDYNADHRAVEKGEVKYQAAREEYKNAMAYFHEWFKEGLIDVEVFSQDASQYIAKGKNENVVLGSYVWWEIPEVVGNERADMYTYLPILTDKDGKSNVNLNDQNTVGRDQFSVTKSCKNPTLLLKWVDQMYAPEMSMQAVYGPIGVFFEEQKDSNGVYTNKKPPEGTTEGELKAMNELLGPVAQLSEQYGTLYYMEDRAQQRLDDLKDFWFKSITNFDYFPNVIYTLEETEIINDKLSDIKSFTAEKSANWLLNGGVEDEWDSYVSQLEQMGLKDVVKCWQDAYDRYMAATK